MSDDFELTRFEQELLRRLRALPFEVQQHVSRYIIRLQREHGTVPLDEMSPTKPGEPRGVRWDMTADELAQAREEEEKRRGERD